MVSTGLRYITHLVGSQTMLFLLIATIVFVLPTLDFSNPERILKLTAAGLFIVSPLEIVFTAYYFHNKALVAVKNINDLETRLDLALDNQDAAYKPSDQPWGDFKEITTKNLSFTYPGEGATYGIGPLDLTIKRGTITFITGGNGSGKSTLLKVLIGLYPPTEGHIILDNHVVSANGYPSYRELYSAIFGDFHLFDRLYGLRDIDILKVEDLLIEMKIDDKTSFIDDAFENLDLSTGQRKRLAMVIARLEEKQIYIFDEWAADQDPQSRKYYYEKLLPKLKAEGKRLLWSLMMMPISTVPIS